MRFTSTSLKLSLSLVIITFFIVVAISCDDKHAGNDSSSTSVLDSSQIKKLADNYQQGKTYLKRIAMNAMLHLREK